MPAVIWCLVCAIEKRYVVATKRVDGDPMCDACAGLAPEGSQLTTLNGGSRMPAAAPKTDFAKIREALEARPKLPPAVPVEPRCSRGCGKPTHRGHCAGHKPSVPVFPKPAAAPAENEVMQKLLERYPAYETLTKNYEKTPAPSAAADAPDHAIKFEIVPLTEWPQKARPAVGGRIAVLWRAMVSVPLNQMLRVPCRDKDHASRTCAQMVKRAQDAKTTIDGVSYLVEATRVGEVCSFRWVKAEGKVA